MNVLYRYKGEIVSLSYMQAVWFIECIKEPFESWLETQEKIEKNNEREEIKNENN